MNSITGLRNQKQDSLGRRKLNNELRGIDALQTRQAKHILRDQLEIERELWRLTEARRKRQIAMHKEAREMAVKTAQTESSVILRRIRTQLNYRQTTDSLRNQKLVTNDAAEMSSCSQSSSACINTGETQHRDSPSQISQPFSSQRLNTLPKLGRNNSVMGSFSLRSSANMASLMGSQSIAQKDRKSGVHSSWVAVSEINLSELQRHHPETQVPVTLENLPLNNDFEATPRKLRETTREKLRITLRDQGIDVDNSAVGPRLSRLTEEIIAMRNLGKTSDQVWEDVRNCRYLRGYEPPIMRIPGEAHYFAFGKSSSKSDLHTQHIMNIAHAVQEAATLE